MMKHMRNNYKQYSAISLRICLTILLGLFSGSSAVAQGYFERGMNPDSAMTPLRLDNGDTIYVATLPNLIVPGHKYKPLTREEQQELRRRIRDVKKTLPLAKDLAGQLIETYEYIETLPTEKERSGQLRAVEKELIRHYKPQMKELTLRQGKLLIKLMSRQCNQTSYKIVQAFFGSWKAAWWNFFAGFYGASLKETYDPENNPDDAVTERIVQLVQHGKL